MGNTHGAEKQKRLISWVALIDWYSADLMHRSMFLILTITAFGCTEKPLPKGEVHSEANEQLEPADLLPDLLDPPLPASDILERIFADIDRAIQRENDAGRADTAKRMATAVQEHRSRLAGKAQFPASKLRAEVPSMLSPYPGWHRCSDPFADVWDEFGKQLEQSPGFPIPSNQRCERMDGTQVGPTNEDRTGVFQPLHSSSVPVFCFPLDRRRRSGDTPKALVTGMIPGTNSPILAMFYPVDLPR